MYKIDLDKDIFVESANNIPNWRKMTPEQLMDGYMKEKDTLYSNYYISALICKYWKDMCRYAYKNKNATTEDCYNWLINSILTTIKYSAWNNKDNLLYNDPNAVDKSIHVVLKSNRDYFYIQRARQKRSINNSVLSLDKLQEEINYLDTHDLNGKNQVEELFTLEHLLVNKYYKEKRFFYLFFVASICNNKDISFVRGMTYINEEFCHFISNKYNLDIDVIKKYYETIYSKFSRYQIDNRIRKIIPQIKEDILNFSEV